MPSSPSVVLIDTNVIFECHAKGCWNALAGAFTLETVEECITETQTGHQRRRPERRIDETLLRRSLAAVHAVTNAQRAQVLVSGGAGLDAGERDLWAHALTRQDAWVLCGPDRASMRFGYENGQRDRLVALGGLLSDIRFRPPVALAEAYERPWLESLLSKLVLGVL